MILQGIKVASRKEANVIQVCTLLKWQETKDLNSLQEFISRVKTQMMVKCRTAYKLNGASMGVLADTRMSVAKWKFLKLNTFKYVNI